MCTTFLYRSAGLTVAILLLHLFDDVFPPLCELVCLQDGLVDVLSSFLCRSLEGKRCFYRHCYNPRAGSSNEKQRIVVEMWFYAHIISCFHAFVSTLRLQRSSNATCTDWVSVHALLSAFSFCLASRFFFSIARVSDCEKRV